MVLVSETMLQQTQAARVAERIGLFLTVLPTIHDLAAASNGTMIRQWQGMGYNSRALRLRDAALAITERYGGVIPSDVGALLALPGVGPYTSAAIACFAYNKHVVVLDVNVRRVYSRLASRMATTTDVLSDELLAQFAQRVIPQRRSAMWHHAVMDLGATICTARKPKCDVCPMADMCPSAYVMKQGQRTLKREPMFREEPQRIWRGRIIEALRGVPSGRSITITSLSTMLLGQHTQEEHEWLTGMIAVLETAGHITRSGRLVRLAD
jgi:A/G-specific adenine glycosylase